MCSKKRRRSLCGSTNNKNKNRIKAYLEVADGAPCNFTLLKVFFKLLVRFLKLFSPQAQIDQSQNVCELNPILSSQVNPKLKC
jgi:hypothetical protein